MNQIESSRTAFDDRLLDDGTYQVQTRLVLRDGTVLGPETTTFTKLNEADAFAAWWQNDLGSTERLIPPFTTLTLRRDRVSLLGRTYRLNALGLPSEIASQGGEVLAEAARIVVTVNGHEQVVPVKGLPRFTERKAWRHAFTGTATGAGLRFTVTGTIEQDGLVMLQMTYAPAGKDPVAVDALRLEFPVRADVAETLVCIGAGGNYASHTATVLPQDTQGQLWSTLDTGIGGSMMTVGSFYPQVWLGNEQRGFLWWADSDEGWTPNNAVPAHAVVRQGDAMVLRNHIISRPETLQDARTLTFSYMASPFKPLPKGWRMAIYSEDGTFGTPGHKTRTDPKTKQFIDGWNWLSPPSYDPAEWSALWAENKQQADAKVRVTQWSDPASARNKNWVHTSIPMRGYGVQTSDRTVSNYFAAEWGDGNYNPTMRDYLIWLCDRNFTEGGLRTIYWDIFYTSVINDLQAGYGYTLPDGRIQPTFHGYNLRRFMMRLYALMDDRGLTPGANVAHSSNAFPLVAFPWVDAVLDGEFVFFRDSTEGDFVDYYPSARMRSMAVPENWGTQISWMMLNHVTDKERQVRLHRSFTDWQRMHDTWRGQDGRVPPETILDWGLNDARMTYRPYWRNPAGTASDHVLVSAWTMPGRAVLMVFNNADQTSGPREVQVRIDRQALGLPEGDLVVKEIGGTLGGGMPANTPKDPDVSFDSATGTITIPGLQAHTARYIGLRVQEPADVVRIRQELATVGAPLTEAMLDWGLVGQETTFQPVGKVTQVRCTAPGVQVSLWQQADRMLLAVKNAGATDVPVTLAIDLDALKLTPQLPWQEFLRVRDFTGGHSTLDFHTRTLALGTVKVGATRVIGIRRY